VVPSADSDDDPGLAGDAERTARRIQEAARFDALARLAGGIAHHVNNKLTVIIGHADFALTELPPDSQARDDLEAIRAISQELADLAHQVLAVAGRGGVAVRPIDLNDLVQGNDHLLHAALPDGIRLGVRLDDGLPVAIGDPGQISDALLHLVRRAGERAAAGAEVVVRTRVRTVDADQPAAVVVDGELRAGEYVALEVTTPGSLPDPHVVAAWFEPFASGLAVDEGLAMPAVLGIARGHRGGVQVVAELGTGTTVTVLFPAAPVGARSVGAPEATQEADSAA